MTKLLEEYVDVIRDPVAGKLLGRWAEEEPGACRFLGVTEAEKTDHQIFIIDSGLDVKKLGKPGQTVQQCCPGYSSKLGHNLLLLRNPTQRDSVFFLQYFSGGSELSGAVVLSFFVLIPARKSLLFDAFDFTIPGSTTNVSQRFFGVIDIFPPAITWEAFGDGRFLLSIRPLSDAPQSLLTLHGVTAGNLNFDLVEYYESLPSGDSDSLESRLVRINNTAIGYAYREEYGTARSLFTVALKLAEKSALSAYFQALIKRNLRLVKTGLWGLQLQQERWEPDRFMNFRPRLPYQYEPRLGWSEWDD